MRQIDLWRQENRLIKPTTANGVWHCGYCDGTIAYDHKFCSSCGLEIDWELKNWGKK